MPSSPVIEVSERAAEKIREFLKDEPSLRLRLSVVRSHCMGGRGHAYDLQIAQGAASTDVIVESGGVTFLIPPESVRMLQGTSIDYKEALEGSGFAIENPNAIGKCPCGHHDLFG